MSRSCSHSRHIEAEFVNAKEVAKITGLSEIYLAKLRGINSPDCPPWFRVGRRCLYPLAALREWANTRVNTHGSGVGR